MKDVFDNEPSLEEVTESQGEPEVEHVEPETAEHVEPKDATPPVAETSKNVPLQALEAERTKRREFRDKFHQAEGELKALREQLKNASANGYPAAQQQAQPQYQDPVQRAAYQAVEMADNSRFDMSEMMAREKFGDELVDKAFQHVSDVNDPTVWSRIKAAKHPWAEVVKESKRLEILGQMGDDPLTYEQKLKEKWAAEINQAPAAAPVKPNVPASLAGSRSSAGRTTAAFTGEPSFKDLFN